MTQEFSRFDTNFSVLMQEQCLNWSIQKSRFAGALGQTILEAKVFRFSSMHTRFLPFQAQLHAPFLQFSDAIDRPSFAIPLPSIKPISVGKNESHAWMGVWKHLTATWIDHLSVGLREMQTSLSAIVNALSSPITLAKREFVTNAGSISLRPLNSLTLQTGPTETIQSSIPFFSIPQLNLPSRETIFDTINRHLTQETFNSFTSVDVATAPAVPLVSFTATMSQPDSRQPTTFPAQVGAILPRASPAGTRGAYSLMHTVSELSPTARSSPTSVSPYISQRSTVETSLSTIAARAVPFVRGVEPTSNIDRPSEVVLPRSDRSLSPKLPPPVSSSKSSGSEHSSTSVTFNGGIHVQITAQTVDREHAQETARTIAEQVMREVNRITERNRFRRGL